MIPGPIYYECHVTIEPVCFDTQTTRYLELQSIVEPFGFRLAKLYMQKGNRSDKDAFCTAHSSEWEDIYGRMAEVVGMLREYGFEVRRYKIESVLFDSRHGSTI